MFILQTPENMAKAIGSRIRMTRLARNLSQAELAAMTDVSLSSIKRLEATGQGTLQLLASVAVALHATDGLETLFVQPAQTIAQAEAVANVFTRKRARKASLKRVKVD